MFSRPPSNVARYALTFLALAVATLLRFWLTPILGLSVPFILYFPAVVICAWLGGLVHGLLSTVVGGLVAWYVFIPPQFSFRMGDRTAPLQLLVFLIAGVLISLLAESLHRAKRKAEASAEELRKQRDQLRLAMESEQAARQELERVSQLKDQFLAIVSHELRTPLTAVLGWADPLRKEVLDEERRQDALEALYASARRQALLIDDLLDLGRITSGKLRLENAKVDLEGVIRGALEVVAPSAAAKRIHISTAINPTNGEVIGDAARLQQVVWNLLTNAVKFTPEDGTIHLAVREADDRIEIAVTDTGKGLSPDFVPRMFKPFQQAEGSTTRSHGGLGLGLSIVKHIVESHGGTVTAESAGEGRGSRFTVRLPLTPVTTAQEPAVTTSV